MVRHSNIEEEEKMSKHWHCLFHDVDIVGRAELAKHQEKECVLEGDNEEE